LEFDFIAEYPLWVALPNPAEASLFIESILPVKVACPAVAAVSDRRIVDRRSTLQYYAEELAAAMEASNGARAATGSVG
jgi:hypothetical protein